MIWIIYMACIVVLAWWAWGEYMPKVRAMFAKPKPAMKWDESPQMSDNCRSYCQCGPLGETNTDYMTTRYTGALPWLGDKPPEVYDAVEYDDDRTGVRPLSLGTGYRDPQFAGTVSAVHRLKDGKRYEVTVS